MRLEPSLRFDHFAYPVDDLVKAEDFYTGVLEIPIYERRGLRVRDVQAGTLPRTFLNVAGSRVGIFLGRESLPEYEQRRGCPLVGLEITGDGMTRVVRRLEETHYKNYDEPRPRHGLGPDTISLLIQDPFGNHLELLQKDRVASNGASAYVGIGQLELEVTNLDQSVDFYTNVFGLKLIGHQNDSLGRATAYLHWSAANGSCFIRSTRCTRAAAPSIVSKGNIMPS
jgi:catechol 2,3-dioxygenase-like lactoylglutathione lyase family enzyme